MLPFLSTEFLVSGVIERPLETKVLNYVHQFNHRTLKMRFKRFAVSRK